MSMNSVMELVSTDSNSFFDLMVKSYFIQSECKDFNVSNVTNRNMYYDGDKCKLVYLPDGGDTYRSMSVTDYSLNQLCNKIGIPAKYVDKCIDSGRLDLAADNINSWLDDYGRNLFVREFGSSIRGILSDRFSVLDTPSILESVSEVADLGEYNVKGYFISPERFHARIVQKDMMRINDEDLFAGIQIDSSDVGRSILIVRFMIWKQVCTNGLCISKCGGVLYRQKHIGIDALEFRNEFKDSLSNIPVLIENAKELVNMARKDSKNFGVRNMSSDELSAFVEWIKLKTKLHDDGADKVISLMNSKYGNSRWGFVNSLTEVAQDFSLERRIELETIAGDFLAA